MRDVGTDALRQFRKLIAQIAVDQVVPRLNTYILVQDHDLVTLMTTTQYHYQNLVSVIT